MATESLEGIVSSIDKTSSLDILEENALTKREVKRLYSHAKKEKLWQRLSDSVIANYIDVIGNVFYAQKERNWQRLRKFVSDDFNYFKDFPDDEVEILTFLLQYSLLNLTSKPMRRLGRHKRKTGRLTPAHSIDGGSFLVEGYKKLFEYYTKFGHYKEYVSIVIKALTTERKLTYKHIAGPLLHDVPEDTFGIEGEVTLEQIVYDLSMFIIESDRIKDKERYIEEVRDIVYIVGGLTKYKPIDRDKFIKKLEKVFSIIDEAKSEKVVDKQKYDERFKTLMLQEPIEVEKVDYYKFTKEMLEEPKDPDLLKNMLIINQVKLIDAGPTNGIETISLEKTVGKRAYSTLKKIIVGRWEDTWFIEWISRGKYRFIKNIVRFRDRYVETLVEKASKIPIVKKISYWAERDRALTGAEKLLTYFKAFRVADVNANQYMNKYGFDPLLNYAKIQGLEAMDGRIRGMTREILKYECAGFDRTYLDDKPENPFECIDGLVYDNGKAKIEKRSWLWKEVRKGERLASLGFEPEEILENPEIILGYDVLESLYREKLKKDEKAGFDVFDEIRLKKKFENYRKSGNLFKRTKEQKDPISASFNILEADYDKFAAGDKRGMKEINENIRKQYIHLLVFGGLNKGYLDDMYEDKEHTRPKINIDENGKIIEGKNYLTFDWGITG